MSTISMPVADEQVRDYDRAMAKKQIVDVKVIIPDSSPIMTLDRIGRLDLLGRFKVPVHIVDQVHYEVTKPDNDPTGQIAEGLKKLGNSVVIVQTNVGEGFQLRRARNPNTPSRNLGEIAVDEYATLLAHTSGPTFVPLVLFEDPDVFTLRIASMKNVHLLNTTGFLKALQGTGELTDGQELINKINALRVSPMDVLDKPARTKKIRSQWIKRHDDNDN